MASTTSARPKYAPRSCSLPSELAPESWLDVLEFDAAFGSDVFDSVLTEIVEHPERNSSLILRTDIVQEESSGSTSSASTSSESSEWSVKRTLTRKLLPNRPGRDDSLLQRCIFYEAQAARLVVMEPLVRSKDEMPYYHPEVRKLGFRYEQTEATVEGGSEAAGKVIISIILFDEDRKGVLQGDRDLGPLDSFGSTDEPRRTTQTSLPNRLYRTCHHLGDQVHRYGWGRLSGYKKRVHHDVMIDRASFQDLYLIMKERHKHLDSRKDKPGFNKLLEDKKRHVWKDVAVATFLMLLWRDIYPRQDAPPSNRPWDGWGRPPSGFMDIGCGNGLLVHILISEGYTGIGLELRARRTWPTYPEATQAALRESTISPPDWFPANLAEWNGDREDCPVKSGMFLIGNHADEMTPWIPLFSLLPSTPVSFLSLPCCTHKLSGMFTSTVFKLPRPHSALPVTGLSEGLEEGESRYKAYLMWLGWAGLECGWKWDREVLRLPTTKNWAIVGRSRWTTTPEEDAACRQWAFDEVEKVRRAGGFVPRAREGAVH